MSTKQTQTFAAGQLVEGRYRIERLLAQGGMGAVYHAIQEPLGRDVAVKVLKPADDTAAKRAQREKRFFREAAVSGRLTHPNTIVVLDYGKLSEQPGFFLVMEYLEGKSLRELLIERGALGTRVTLHVTMQIASSLADAHRANCVHRDLKPPNVMLVPRGEDPYFVKVVDFGLVKELEPDEGEEELTSENALVGSPMYMAPERFLSHNADSPAVDVYSLGIMMYEMLVGRAPFVRASDSTLQHIMMQHIQDVPPPMREVRPDLELPPGLEALIMKCLEKRPEDRIQSMDSLLRLLRSCAQAAGMSVAGPVEDTGAFLQPDEIKALKNAQNSNELLPGETGGGQHATVEQPWADDPTVVDPAGNSAGNLGVTSGLVDVSQSIATKKNTLPLAFVFSVLLLVAAGVGYVALAGSPETARAGDAEFVVNSSPSGATIWIQDEQVGSTPFVGALDVPESATLRIEKDGFEPFYYRFPPSPDRGAVVNATLVPLEVEPLINDPADTNGQGGNPPPDGKQPDSDARAEQPDPAADADAEPKNKQRPKPRPDEKPDKKPSDPDIKLDR